VRVILFDVGQGFCAFLKSDTGCTLLIDCSGSEGFSPAKYILQNELANSVPFFGHPLTMHIVTHPHEDHIKDVENLIKLLPPYILLRAKYDWERVKRPDYKNGEYEKFDKYVSWQERYSAKPSVTPDWGRMGIEWFRAPAPPLAVGTDNNAAVNNSSYAVVVTVQGDEFKEHKLLFGGDLEESGWEALLLQKRFRDAVRGTTFYFASHHGHKSGFSSALFAAMGKKPLLNLISATNCYDSREDRYSTTAEGLMFGPNRRSSLTTLTDGSIFIDIPQSGWATVQTVHLPNNVFAKKPQQALPNSLAWYLKHA
jgi:beta-lactamase superfamily II metal-dependent hydrolase